MMPRLAIGGTALAGSPADFGDDDIGVMQDGWSKSAITLRSERCPL